MLWKSETVSKSSFDARTDHDYSWEEEAFAEDAAQPFGAFAWPPRSYFCSFCKREFRSAQALGGHMNVHRRERARLKQFPSATPSAGHHSKDCNGYQNQTRFLFNNVNFSGTSATVSSNLDIDIFSSWCVKPVQHEVFRVLNSERKEDQVEDLKKKRSRIQQDVFELPDICQEVVNSKRQRIDESSAEYLDLELRLGDQPNLKQIQ